MLMCKTIADMIEGISFQTFPIFWLDGQRLKPRKAQLSRPGNGRRTKAAAPNSQAHPYVTSTDNCTITYIHRSRRAEA
jgi:hypothetical protein